MQDVCVGEYYLKEEPKMYLCIHTTLWRTWCNVHNFLWLWILVCIAKYYAMDITCNHIPHLTGFPFLSRRSQLNFKHTHLSLRVCITTDGRQHNVPRCSPIRHPAKWAKPQRRGVNVTLAHAHLAHVIEMVMRMREWLGVCRTLLVLPF